MEKQSNQGAGKPSQGGEKSSQGGRKPKDKQKGAEGGGSQKEGKTKAELKAERRAKQVCHLFFS